MKIVKPKTKIVATLGPASNSPETLLDLIRAGVNIFRINFSHSTLEDHKKTIDAIRSLNNKYKFNIGILGDLCGPKIRVGNFGDTKIELKKGDKISFTTNNEKTNPENCFLLEYDYLAKDIKKGDSVLIDDGKMELKVLQSDGVDTIECEVIFGGLLSSRKGVNFPVSKLTLPSLTDHDLDCLNFALSEELEWIALSFVRRETDVLDLRKIINQSNKHSKVMAKIEKPEALNEIEGIVQMSDAVMIARGDLGIEIPMEKVPVVQKNIIKICRKYCKPVVVATQMLETMTDSARPTRAEVNDVANSVLDGADAVMLSGETSVGKFPVKSVETMRKIIVNIEETAYPYYNLESKGIVIDDKKLKAICSSAVFSAKITDSEGIVTLTATGTSAFTIAAHRPKAYTFVFTGNHKLLNMLNLVWGVQGFFFDEFISTDHTIEKVNEILMREHLIEYGDVIINTASIPIKKRGRTNMIKITTVE